MTFDDLHDAVLESVELNFAAGRLRLTVRPVQWPGAPSTVHIIAHEWSQFVCPREEPWGASVSVNSCDGPVPIEGGGFRITVALQSGDSLEITAKRIELIETGAQRET
ncbi:MAG TPA: hypothetical protein VG755_24625 [Nannocystaceae bacterium]|nr:hypothetical protein [Nannocystaceae bacterium]